MPMLSGMQHEIDARVESKALRINVEKRFYGTFAEIGAGQEVARHFFPLVVQPERLQKRFLPMT